MGRMIHPVATESRHGSELFLRYLDAAWADCVVSDQTGAALFYGELPTPMELSVKTLSISYQAVSALKPRATDSGLPAICLATRPKRSAPSAWRPGPRESRRISAWNDPRARTER